MIQSEATPIPGCLILRPKVFTDARGSLTKIFHKDWFGELGLGTDPGEIYYSVSRKGVLRGLHLQEPPHSQDKLVGCLSGKIFDVAVDLRRGSPSFGRHFSIELDAKLGCLLYVPAGLAHGFAALSDGAIFFNRATSVHAPESDTGIRWDSCGIEWPGKDWVVSIKDKALPPLAKYDSPFTWQEAGTGMK